MLAGAIATLAFSSSEAAPKGPKNTCAVLSREYENASKRLAANETDDLMDDSAVRATMRQTQNNNIIENAHITLELMRNNKCALPTSAPSAERYGGVAAYCKLVSDAHRFDRQLGKASSEDPEVSKCEMQNWKPEKVSAERR